MAEDDAPTPDDDAAIRRALAERRADASRRLAALTGRFEEIVSASEGSNADDEHDPEGTTIAFERSQVDALARQATSELADLAAAEARLEAGTYGTCAVCGRPIPHERVLARPTATTCVPCATRAR